MRAERFGACPNGDLAIGMDGLVRWLGAPVGSLAAGEEWLSPRLILFADEQLTGAALDKVRARAERFVAHHIETHLKPLTDLGKADELSGIARGIAFRLIESHGIVQRREIASDLKALDQDGRAALRRYGARFGFYHIFVPALIKPAPAGLMTLLWAIRHDGRDKAGHGDVVGLLASGRTSLVTDQGFERDFFKLAGYRHLGPRAVRVDILERLADLIRPCIFFKPGADTLPEGAYGGGRFVVTPAMLSILGATMDDMAEVLKALGYRHEAVGADEADAHLAALRAEHGPGPAPEEAAPQAAASAESGGGEADADAAVEETGTAVADEAVPAPDATADGAGPGMAPPDPSPAPAEPQPVLVWRQGSGGRRPDRRSGQRASARGEGEAHGRNAKGRASKPADGEGRHKGKRPRKGPRRGPEGPRTVTARPPGRERAADPDSPFAKLQALKDRLDK